MSDLDMNRIERLKNKLYSKATTKDVLDSTRGGTLEDGLPREEIDRWGKVELPEAVGSADAYHPKSTRFFKALFVISAVFCVIAAVVAIFIFITRFNRISSDNIDLNIRGPVSIGGGEDLSLAIGLINNNNTDLVDAIVKIEYPEGTYVATNTAEALPRSQMNLDTVTAGSQKQVSFDAVIFGEENVEKKIMVSVEYRLQGSKTLYTKEKEYDVLLTKAPISLLVSYDKSINSGQDLALTITAVSNSKNKLPNVILKAAYPSGWSLHSATPNPASNTQDTWQLGSFNPGEQKIISLRGSVYGQEGENKVFRFSMGTANEQNPKLLATSFVEFFATMSVQKPFILSALSFGSEKDNSDVVAKLGDRLEGTLNLQNNLTSDLVDVVVQITPQGNFFDRYAVYPGVGFYKSDQNIIYWDKSLYKNLATFAAGAKEELRFRLNTLAASQLTGYPRNPQIAFNVTVSGKSLANPNDTKNVRLSFVKTVKFASQPSIMSATLYNTGPFKNSGPTPPRAEQKTTYTLGIDIRNTSNQISNGVVTATLPFYVEFATSSPSENISFDPKTRVVTWNLGEIAAYAGSEGPVRIARFQVAITPSTSQIRTAPILASDIKFTGVDRFTGAVVQLGASSLTTNASIEGLSGTVLQ